MLIFTSFDCDQDRTSGDSLKDRLTRSNVDHQSDASRMTSEECQALDQGLSVVTFEAAVALEICG
jgi:hypothetical protein